MAKTRYDYSIKDIRKMSERERRRIYSDMRDIARKRAQRLINAGYGEYDISKMDRFPTARQAVKEGRNYVALILDIQKRLRDPRSKVGTIKSAIDKNLAAINENYAEINRENLKRFHDYMDMVYRKTGNKKVRDSDTPAQIFNEAERLNIDSELLMAKMEEWLDSNQDLHKILKRLKKNKKRMSNETFAKLGGGR